MPRLVLSLIVTLAVGGAVALAPTAGSPAATPPAVSSPAASPAAVSSSAASEPSAPSSPGARAGAVPAPAASPVSTVHVKNFAYVPDTVTIHPGQTVRFVQDDETPHTVTATDHTFDSGNLDKGRSWTHTFDKEGTYAYLCAYHTSMRGNVVVK